MVSKSCLFLSFKVISDIFFSRVNFSICSFYKCKHWSKDKSNLGYLEKHFGLVSVRGFYFIWRFPHTEKCREEKNRDCSLFSLCIHLGFFWSWLHLSTDMIVTCLFIKFGSGNSITLYVRQLILWTNQCSAKLHVIQMELFYLFSYQCIPFVSGTNGHSSQRWTQSHLMWLLIL